jgi:hypothetical protein
MLLFSAPCAYCGDPPSRINRIGTSEFPYNGIDRIDNLLGYTAYNCASCCKKCNETKRDMTLNDFRLYIRRLYSTMFEGI